MLNKPENKRMKPIFRHWRKTKSLGAERLIKKWLLGKVKDEKSIPGIS